jgi:hypothetical protein
VELDDDDVDEDEEKAEIADEALWKKRSRKLTSETFYPIDEMTLEIMRRERISEVEMWSVLAKVKASLFSQLEKNVMLVLFIGPLSENF